MTPKSVTVRELAKFQGTWVAVAFEGEGVTTPEEHLGTVQVVIEEDRYHDTEPGGEFEGRYRLDPTKRPREIDRIPTTGVSALPDEESRSLRVGGDPVGSGQDDEPGVTW